MVICFFIKTFSKFWLSILILKVQRTSMSFKSSFLDLEDAGGSWLGFGIFILIWIWSLALKTNIIQIWALYLDFEGTKTINVLEVLIWGFEGSRMFLTGVWYLYHDSDMATGLWYSHDPNFGPLSWIWRCKEHKCPLNPHSGIWRMLEVPDWVWHLDLDFDMVNGLLYTHDPNLGSPSSF